MTNKSSGQSTQNNGQQQQQQQLLLTTTTTTAAAETQQQPSSQKHHQQLHSDPLDGGSSLSSLHSDDDEQQEHQKQKQTKSPSIPPPNRDQQAHSSPPKLDLDADPSELGEDVCLEYTDFGQDLGFPVTWSESEYDEDHHQTEEPEDEFAEFLLMDTSEGDHSFGFEQLENLQASSKYTQIMASIKPSNDPASSNATDDQDSLLGYMIIEELNPEDDEEEEEEEDDDDDPDHKNNQSLSGDDDGATTDSLDEDDHSGLVRFGIEAEDANQPNSEEDDPNFFDLPTASSAIGSMLDLAVISGTPDSNNPAEREIKLPIMGTFSVDRQDGTNAGRTIIDAEKSLPLSPFTGTKVIRYNRFRKLRQQSCTGDSEQSSMTDTPKPDDSQNSIINPGTSANGALPEPEFDISAFIRGISSIDEGCSDGEKSPYDASTAELDGLSRWQRVPITAFRRRMVMMNCPEGREDPGQMILDGAIQPSSSSLGETLGLSSQPSRSRKKRGPSSSLHSLDSSKVSFTRRDHRKVRKTTSSNSHGKQSKPQSSPDHPDQLLLDSHTGLDTTSTTTTTTTSTSTVTCSSLADSPSLILHSSDAFHSTRLFDELLDLDPAGLATQSCNPSATLPAGP